MERVQIDALASKIAAAIAGSTETADISKLMASIEKLNQRLDVLEAGHASVQTNQKTKHPSHETFAICETSADTSDAKMCGFEPHNRPCDHCSMCSSRGF